MTLSDERIQEIAVQAGLRCREELSREASRLVWTPPTCVIASAIRQAVTESHAWRPIETAPKDGTEILGWREDAGTLVIRWTSANEFLTESELEGMSEEDEFKEDWFYADFVCGGRLEGSEAPTLWTHLPAPLPQPPETPK